MKTSIVNRNSDSILDVKWSNYGKQKLNNDEYDDELMIDKFRQLKTRQINLFEYALKILEQVNDDVVRYLCSIYRSNSTLFNDNKFEIRSLLYLIKQLLFDSQNKFKKAMNETNCISSNIEDILIQKKETNGTKMSPTTAAANDDELKNLKETIEALKIDRKRLKCEKLELLNQTKELFKTIESKENEIREFLRHYENKTKETSFAVKRLIEHKADIERERLRLQHQNNELIETNNQMKFLLESKDATIIKLQKQLQEHLSTKNKTRFSLSKDSVDYGYLSGKSRDTLICLTTSTQTTPNKSDNDDENIFICESSITNATSETTTSSSNNSLEHNHNQAIIIGTTTSNSIQNTPQSNHRNSKSIMTESSTSYNESNDSSMRASLPIIGLNKSKDMSYPSLNQLSVSLNAPKISSTPPTQSIASDSSIVLSSSYCSNDSKQINKLKNDYEAIISLDQQTTTTTSVDKWQQNTIKEWLELIGMQPSSIKTCLKYIKCGKALLNLNDNDLERVFFITNPIHKRKIRLALDELKAPEKIKYKKLNLLTQKWICNTWLNDIIGLKQYQSTFKMNLIDGRLLATLQRKDLEKYFCIKKRLHQTSILLGIELLRKYDFDIEHVDLLRQESDGKDISLWTNESLANWLKTINLQQYDDNLSESGLHGALLVDSSFSLENFYELLRIDDLRLNSHNKKLVEDEFKMLKKSKQVLKQNQNESVFMRSLSTFKNDKKLFTFRGSLGRALGKKIKREISSPLIDDDTYKRIEYNHKIVDVRNYSITSAV